MGACFVIVVGGRVSSRGNGEVKGADVWVVLVGLRDGEIGWEQGDLRHLLLSQSNSVFLLLLRLQHRVLKLQKS